MPWLVLCETGEQLTISMLIKAQVENMHLRPPSSITALRDGTSNYKGDNDRNPTPQFHEHIFRKRQFMTTDACNCSNTELWDEDQALNGAYKAYSTN